MENISALTFVKIRVLESLGAGKFGCWEVWVLGSSDRVPRKVGGVLVKISTGGALPLRLPGFW